MIEKENITGIILSGGKSSRMGSDKAMLKLNGLTFIECIINAMKPIVSKIMIVSDFDNHNYFGCQKVEDSLKDAGPLSGLYSGLKNSTTQFNLVLSCDIPLIKIEVLRKLVESDYQNFDVTQIQSDKKSMPLIAIYKKDCMTKCLELLEQNERRLRVAVAQFKTKSIDIDSSLNQYVKNVNTKEDLIALNHEIEY